MFVILSVYVVVLGLELAMKEGEAEQMLLLTF